MSFLDVHPLGSKWNELCFDKLVFPGWDWQLRSASDILFLCGRVPSFYVALHSNVVFYCLR